MGLMGHFDDAHLLKVDVDGIVQDALTVCLVHHDQRVHLQQQPQPNVIFTRLLLQKSLKDTGKCTQKKKLYLFSGDVCLQQQMLSAGEVREQRSSFGAERVFPGEASL